MLTLVFSNKPVDLISLNTDNTKVLISEWKDTNAGGCHIVESDTGKKKLEDAYSKKVVTWLDNPKFHISFDNKDRIPEVSLEIYLSRAELIWNKKISNSIVNSMVGIYIFRYDKEKWKDSCLNLDKVDFIPKNDIMYKFSDVKVDPKGFIIMPTTYGKDVYGPFTLMVKCKEKFNLTVLNIKKNQD